ncbi:MAG: hypothetical protein MJZ38_01865 [archaeon]|nr:hypothetical protein [archaeon]
MKKQLTIEQVDMIRKAAEWIGIRIPLKEKTLPQLREGILADSFLYEGTDEYCNMVLEISQDLQDGNLDLDDLNFKLTRPPWDGDDLSGLRRFEYELSATCDGLMTIIDVPENMISVTRYHYIRGDCDEYSYVLNPAPEVMDRFLKIIRTHRVFEWEQEPRWRYADTDCEIKVILDTDRGHYRYWFNGAAINGEEEFYDELVELIESLR